MNSSRLPNTYFAPLVVLFSLAALVTGCSDVREVEPADNEAVESGVGFGEGGGSLTVPEESTYCEDGSICDNGVCLPNADGSESCA